MFTAAFAERVRVNQQRLRSDLSAVPLRRLRIGRLRIHRCTAAGRKIPTKVPWSNPRAGSNGMIAVGEPVGVGIVRSLNRLESNIIGLALSNVDTAGKRLEFLKQAVRSLSRAPVLTNPRNNAPGTSNPGRGFENVV